MDILPPEHLEVLDIISYVNINLFNIDEYADSLRRTSLSCASKLTLDK